MSSGRSQVLEPLLAAGLLRGSAAARVLSPVGPPCVLTGFAQPARSKHALAGDVFCSGRGSAPGLGAHEELSSVCLAVCPPKMKPLSVCLQVDWLQQQEVKRRVKRHVRGEPHALPFNDPVWPNMWYLVRVSSPPPGLPAPGGAGSKPLGHQQPRAVVPTWAFFPSVEPQPSLGNVVFLLPASSVCV